MKKFLCVILIFCFIFPLTGCKPKMSFENENEMLEYLNGMWKSGDEYYCFVDDTICRFNNQTVIYNLEDYFLEYIKENGYDAYKALRMEAAMNAIESEILTAYQETDYAMDIKKGKIIFNKGSSFEKEIVLTEDHLEVETTIFTKLSDEFDLTHISFTQCFTTATSDLELSPKDFVLSVDKCSEKLKSYHSEILSYIAVNDNGMWSNNGSYNGYNGLFFHDNKTLTFVKKLIGGQYTFTYSDHVTVVQDLSGAYSLEELLQDALIAVSEYPLALTVSELSECYLQNGYADLDITVDGINYQIIRRNGYTIRIESL